MPLSLQSRRVGDITVVKCSGQITGTESDVLKEHLNDLVPRNPDVILNLHGVDFVDSSGIGLLVRFLTRCRTAAGDLKLCEVPARIAKVLEITHLTTIFELLPSEADAVATFYQHAASLGAPYRFKTDILCVEKSADVLAYVREMLKQAGYGVHTTDNLHDAMILLQATKPKLVIVGPEFRATRSTPIGHSFNTAVDKRTVVELPPDFSSHEAGEAGDRLLDRVRAILPVGDQPARTAG